MSTNNSNPLLVDPSIVSISDKDVPTTARAKARTASSSSSSHLDPGNALSKLLDSAMAHAARESTPEPREETAGGGAPASASASASASALDDVLNCVPPKKQGQDLIYTINDLMKLRDVVEAVDVGDKLPDANFWRLKSGRDMGSVGGGTRNGGGGGGGVEAGFRGKKYKRHSHETWERGKNDAKTSSGVHGVRHGFNKAQELDSLSSERITELLGETGDDGLPEWDNADGDGGEGGLYRGSKDDSAHMSMLNMGRSVQDFEKWKYQMRLEERRRNGEVIDEEVEQSKLADDENAAVNAGNEVDNFFSFIKPKEEEDAKVVDDEEKGAGATTGGGAGAGSGAGANSRSSRFTSFFQQPKPQPQQQQQPQQPQQPQSQPQESQQSQPQQQQSAEVPSPQVKKGVSGPPPGFSKFFGGGAQTQAQAQAKAPPVQIGEEGSGGTPPLLHDHKSSQSSLHSSNDNFFLSLLKKKEQQASPSASQVDADDKPNTPFDQLRNRPDQGENPQENQTGGPQQPQQQQQFMPPPQYPQPPPQDQSRFPFWMTPPHQHQPQQQPVRGFPPGFDPSMLGQNNQYQQQTPPEQQRAAQGGGGGSNRGENSIPAHLQGQPRGQQQFPMGPGGMPPPPPPPPGMFPNGFGPPPHGPQRQAPPNFMQGNRPLPPGFPPGMVRMGFPPQFGNPPNAMMPPHQQQQQQHPSHFPQRPPNFDQQQQQFEIQRQQQQQQQQQQQPKQQS
ncbi:uncharacterized protein LODBEIA_P58310 [Lodderomyces beijingensis]|uniref:Uncharacterized protein n=1 Tax=Lodderomyces beijingensis TaxID=1775926 RepID=A0ABP0ZU05_9ASCO